jgi:alanine dehydrogenase
LRENSALLKGLNMTDGKITYPGVAEAFGLPCESPNTFVA